MMFTWFHSVIIFGYILCSLGLMLYGVHCYVMIVLFLLRNKNHREEANRTVDAFNKNRIDYPFVTIQIPVYNEASVIERLIDSAANVDYPVASFEVQILDDSTDHTKEIIDSVMTDIKKRGIDISVIRRSQRTHFKAGALAAGLKSAQGEYVCIFDSDFVIPREYLKRSVALIDKHPKTACVQSRWGHNNRNENWITRAQSIGIDGHFTAEQGARGYSNLCLNFNGTAGIWRKSAIKAAGGWQGDTLTEDLDLSYRAQLCGYKIKYDFDLECPAELPNNVMALKSQQKRWAKGSIETAMKLLPEIFRSKEFPFLKRIEAFLHLTHYFVAVLMCALFFLTLPMLVWTPMPKIGWLLSILWSIIIISAIAPCVMYSASGWVLRRGWFSITHFPSMLVVGTGLCVNNALAVFEALIGIKSEFVRTPKSGSTNIIKGTNLYKPVIGKYLGYIEVLSGIYCLTTLIVYCSSRKYLFGFFIAAYTIGLLSFGVSSLRSTFLIGKTKLFCPKKSYS